MYVRMYVHSTYYFIHSFLFSHVIFYYMLVSAVRLEVST